MGLRLGGGMEIIPLRFLDLRSYNVGYGYDLRTDIVWGNFSATTVEMEYRSWSRENPTYNSHLEIRRFALLQRFYPFFHSTLKVAPYLGLGVTAGYPDRFSMNIKDADHAGIALVTGCEVPLAVKRFWVDPFVRWDFNALYAEYWYSSFSLGAHFIWKLR